MTSCSLNVAWYFISPCFLEIKINTKITDDPDFHAICSHYTCLNALLLLCEREIERTRQKMAYFSFWAQIYQLFFTYLISSHYQLKSRHKIFGAKYISLTLSNCLWIFVRAVFFVYWPGLRIPTIFFFWIQIKACLHQLHFHFTPLLFFLSFFVPHWLWIHQKLSLSFPVYFLRLH